MNPFGRMVAYAATRLNYFHQNEYPETSN